MAEEVERTALAGEHRPQRTGHLADLGAGRDEGAVVEEPLHLHRGIDLREDLVCTSGAREHAVGARHDVGAGASVGRDERGGEVTEGADVLGQRVATSARTTCTGASNEPAGLLAGALIGVALPPRSRGGAAPASGTKPGSSSSPANTR